VLRAHGGAAVRVETRVDLYTMFQRLKTDECDVLSSFVFNFNPRPFIMICSSKYGPWETTDVIIDNFFDANTTCPITGTVTGRVPTCSPVNTCCFEVLTTNYYGK
jgi:hypothetical protein